MVDSSMPSESAPIDSSPEKSAEIVDVDGESKAASTPGAQQVGSKTPTSGNVATAATYPGGFAIDVCFEASKLPLDVAIFNSARAAGGDEKIRKYLQAVLVIGGTALIPGIAHALESRYATPYFLIPPPWAEFN